MKTPETTLSVSVERRGLEQYTVILTQVANPLLTSSYSLTIRAIHSISFPQSDSFYASLYPSQPTYVRPSTWYQLYLTAGPPETTADTPSTKF